MSRLDYSPEFESQVRKAMDVPEPNANTMDALREQFVARGMTALKADLQVDPASNPFRPEKDSTMKQKTSRLSKPEGKSFWVTLHTRPLMAILLALLILMALTGVAYAIGKSLGYIPGLGVVDQNTPFRVLAEPISQTRDGVTITIEKVVLNADQAFIDFTIKGIPSNKISFLQVPGKDICKSYPDLRFPDGTSVHVSGGKISRSLDTGYESQVKYAAIPMNVTDATLSIPCILGASAPGILPENWEVPMHFVLASPDVALTVIPIMENTPSAISQDSAKTTLPVEFTPSPEAGSVTANHLSIIQVIDTGDSYILVGAFTPPVSPSNEKGLYEISDIVLRDGNNQIVADEEFPMELDLRPYYIAATHGEDIWATKFTKNFTPPIRITYQTQYVYSPVSQGSYTFEFDAGTNPQAGQEWNVNQQFQLTGHTVTLTKIKAGGSGFTFFFRTDDGSVDSLGIHSLDAIQIEGYIPIDFGGNGGIGSWSVTKIYSKMPTGKLKVTLSDLYLIGQTEDWTLDWQP